MKKVLFGLFIMLAILTMGPLPMVPPKQGSTYINEFPHRQFGAADSMIIRSVNDNDIVEIWVSPNIGRAAIQRFLSDSLGDGSPNGSGGTLVLMPGVYSIGDNLSLEPPSNVTIRGVSSPSATVQLISTGVLNAQSIFLLNDGQDNVVFENLYLDGDISASWGSGNKYGINFNTTSGSNDDIVIRNCQFVDFTHAIYVSNSTNNTSLKILNNKITTNTVEDDALADAIFVHEGSNSKYFQISGNEITGYTSSNSATGTHAIYFGGDNSIITNNIIYDYGWGTGVSVTGIGIYLVAGGENNLVQGNQFRNVAGDNISIRSANNSILSNKIFGSLDQGIVVEDISNSNCLIQGNHVDSSFTTGIRVLNSTHVNIIGNFLNTAGFRSGLSDDTYRALVSVSNLDDSPDVAETILKVNIEGNHFKAQWRRTKYGIYIGQTDAGDATTQITIGNNIFEGTGNIDTLMAGALYPSRVVNYRQGIPLEHMVFVNSNIQTGIPGDALDDQWAIQRWIKLCSLSGYPGIAGPGEFLIGEICSLRNNVHLYGNNTTFKAMDDSVEDVSSANQWAVYAGMFQAKDDSNWSFTGFIFDGNSNDQDTTLFVNPLGQRHIGIVLHSQNFNGTFNKCRIVDFNHCIWFGSGAATGDGNDGIRIVDNYFKPQTYYGYAIGASINVDNAIGTSAISNRITTVGDTTRGGLIAHNIVEDDSVKTMPSVGGTRNQIPVNFLSTALIKNTAILENFIMRTLKAKAGHSSPTNVRIDSLYTEPTNFRTN